MIATTTLLNTVGAELAQDADVHAMTDVTGFGLLGHSLEMARNSKLTLALRAGDLPLLSEAAKLAQQVVSPERHCAIGRAMAMTMKLPASMPGGSAIC